MGTKDLQRLRQQAFALDEEDRADLAYDLLDTLDESHLTEIDKAWLDEAERRIAEYDAGKTKSVPVEDSIRDIEKRLV